MNTALALKKKEINKINYQYEHYTYILGISTTLKKIFNYVIATYIITLGCNTTF